MLSLSSRGSSPTTLQVGMVSMLSHARFTKAWLALDGGEYDPAVYPKLFAKFGYLFGHGTTNPSFFKLFVVNGTLDAAGTVVNPPYYLLPHNELNTGTRNKNRTLLAKELSKFKSHTHPVGCSGGGGHSHSYSGSWVNGSPIAGYLNANLTMSESYSDTTYSLGHSGHAHSDGSLGSVNSIPATDVTPHVEPLSMSAVACIFTGELNA